MPDETIRSLVAATLRVTDAQAGGDGLWFKAENITEAYLQEHLRSLTAVIEQNLSRIIAILEGSPRIGVPLSEDAWTDGPYRQVLDPVVVGSPLQSKQGCSDGAPVGGPPQVCAGGESRPLGPGVRFKVGELVTTTDGRVLRVTSTDPFTTAVVL